MSDTPIPIIERWQKDKYAPTIIKKDGTIIEPSPPPKEKPDA